LTFTKSALNVTPNDNSTTITFSLNGGSLERTGNLSGTRTLATGITTFSVENASDLITIRITKTEGTNSFSLQSAVYPSGHKYPTGTGHWEEIIS
jgi:hypothetical protein